MKINKQEFKRIYGEGLLTHLDEFFQGEEILVCEDSHIFEDKQELSKVVIGNVSVKIYYNGDDGYVAFIEDA